MFLELLFPQPWLFIQSKIFLWFRLTKSISTVFCLQDDSLIVFARKLFRSDEFLTLRNCKHKNTIEIYLLARKGMCWRSSENNKKVHFTIITFFTGFHYLISLFIFFFGQITLKLLTVVLQWLAKEKLRAKESGNGS